MHTCSPTECTKEDALAYYMKLYSDDVLRTCFLFLRDYQLAEDAYQETFIKVWKSFSTFEGRHNCSIRTWILRIATNTCLDFKKSSWLRHKERELSIEAIPETMMSAPQEARDIYLDVLNLPEKLRAVVILYHYHNLTKSETSSILHISRAAVDRRLKKAYEQLHYYSEEVSNCAERSN